VVGVFDVLAVSSPFKVILTVIRPVAVVALMIDFVIWTRRGTVKGCADENVNKELLRHSVLAEHDRYIPTLAWTQT